MEKQPIHIANTYNPASLNYNSEKVLYRKTLIAVFFCKSKEVLIPKFPSTGNKLWGSYEMICKKQ